ncbi:MAG: hypothetical protein VKO39_04325 [Cyanobacteriota bacterium]|nr:hypothetical protein [Cyanobacteriota bacterium]
MPKLWKRVFAGRRNEADAAAKALQGGIELITPSLIAGWAYHPDCALSDVRLLAGPHLLAQARIDQLRADVEEHLQAKGAFGFELEIAPDLPLFRIDAAPLVLVLSADGSQRFPLSFLGARSSTQERLTTALQPELRGLRGHFDGLTPDGTRIHGWCYKVDGHEPARIWLHAKDLPPRPLICDERRPGMAHQGHSDICGFGLAVSDWPEAAGSTLWATYDAEGVLRLPQAAPVNLPPLAETPATLAVREEQRPAIPHSAAPEELLAHPAGNAEHWQALDSFRRYLDGLERELDRHDEMRLRPSKPKGLWARLLGSR